MGHMQQQITEKQRGWKVETLDGTSYVPGDVEPVPVWMADCAMLYSKDLGQLDILVFNHLASRLEQYVEGNNKITEITEIETGTWFFARLSAPGYLDCTEWCAFLTKKEAREYLRDL